MSGRPPHENTQPQAKEINVMDIMDTAEGFLLLLFFWWWMSSSSRITLFQSPAVTNGNAYEGNVLMISNEKAGSSNRHPLLAAVKAKDNDDLSTSNLLVQEMAKYLFPNALPPKRMMTMYYLSHPKSTRTGGGKCEVSLHWTYWNVHCIQKTHHQLKSLGLIQLVTNSWEANLSSRGKSGQ
jgi:hypothetical protein